MRVVNKTQWRTDHLRSFLSRVAQAELEVAQRKRLIVTVVYCRRQRQTGYAYYHGRNMCIRVARENPGKRDLALLIAHEMGHIAGRKHCDMRGLPRWSWVEGWRELYAWADELPLEKKTPAPKPDRTQQRVEHLRDLLQQWERKAKTAATWIKKYKRRIRAAEKRAAKSPATP